MTSSEKRRLHAERMLAHLSSTIPEPPLSSDWSLAFECIEARKEAAKQPPSTSLNTLDQLDTPREMARTYRDEGWQVLPSYLRGE